jgi:arginase family enzyme
MSAEWPSIADLIVSGGPGEVALIGAPLEQGSVTPGRCDLAPAAVRQALRRLSTYDLEDRTSLTMPVGDYGDVAVTGLMPADAFQPIVKTVSALAHDHRLTMLIGGNNAVTRPAAHCLGLPLEQVGLITLDAHFDMRETNDGPRNGNPVRCLLEDGLPGRNVVQIGLAPFANTIKMHLDALEAGAAVHTIGDVRRHGIEATIATALGQLDHVTRIVVDFDIDVIDRSQMPGAPGARPGGMAVTDFFAAARLLAAEPKVRLVDLTEYDPSLDSSDLSALTAARWVCEILAGFSRREPA